MRHSASIFVAAAALSLGLGQVSMAADLPAQPAYKAPVVMAPVNHWTGCYLGGNLGWGWGSGDVTNAAGTVTHTGSNNGFAGGGQIGCDYQMGAIVIGIRNMFDWANLDESGRLGGGPFAGYTTTAKNNWMDLLTGRIGYAVQPTWLLYFQGGAAWRDTSLQLFNLAGVQVDSSSKTRTGWTIGAGSEYKFAPNWSVFIEYNYADFGTNTANFIVPGVGTFTGNAKTNAQMVLTGVNWRF
jgi:outer membrane immunogenic protein